MPYRPAPLVCLRTDEIPFSYHLFLRREEDLFAYLSRLNRFLKRSTRPPVYQLLFTGKERVALCTDFNLDVLLGGHGFHYVAAVTSDGGLFKSRVQSLFHVVSPLSVVFTDSEESQ